MSTFRTRQAPSPTGYMHIGTARTILFTDLIARNQQGSWFLRLEDTDRTRLVPDAGKRILESLQPLGLSPQEGIVLEGGSALSSEYGVYQEGQYGPYIQSERLGIYHEHAQKMIDKKLAYWSILSEEDKQDLQAFKLATKKPINYLEHAKKTYGEDIVYMSLSAGLAHLDKPALRYAIQREGSVVCDDLLLGKTVFDLSLEEDFVIIKHDGYPTYHFAHCIDDYLMKTTWVIRTQEWYASFGKNKQMFLDYWGEAPQYLHVPYILGETGNKKMSKRDNSVDVLSYLQSGYLPEALVNYLAFLGWNPGSEKELFLSDEDILRYRNSDRIEQLLIALAQDFTVDRMSPSPARFNLEKLQWFNKQYIQRIPVVELLDRSDQLPAHNSSLSAQFIEPWQYSLLLLDQQRAIVLEEFGKDALSILNYTIPNKSDLAWKQSTPAEAVVCLRDVYEQVIFPFYRSEPAVSILDKQRQIWDLVVSGDRALDAQSLFTEVRHVFELVIKDWLTTYSKQTGSHLWPLRLALSGSKQSASPFELLALLPQSVVEKRIESCF